VNASVFHDCQQLVAVLEQGQVLERIAVDQQQVGQVAFANLAQIWSVQGMSRPSLRSSAGPPLTVYSPVQARIRGPAMYPALISLRITMSSRSSVGLCQRDDGVDVGLHEAREAVTPLARGAQGDSTGSRAAVQATDLAKWQLRAVAADLASESLHEGFHLGRGLPGSGTLRALGTGIKTPGHWFDARFGRLAKVVVHDLSPPIISRDAALRYRVVSCFFSLI
jgi:hypothetical protein